MFDPDSRYSNLATRILTTEGGRTIAYVERRILPHGGRMNSGAEIPIAPGERMDLVAARTLGDPELYWRICDVNNVMNPAQLTADQTGQTLRLPSLAAIAGVME